MSSSSFRLLVPLIAAAFSISLPPARAVAADAAQKRFASPEQAAQALVAALKVHDKPALLTLIGSDAEDIVDSGDPVADREAGERFVAQFEIQHKLVKLGDAEMELEVGEDDWPLPIPLVKDAKGWRFDGAAGVDEVVARRVGRNELFAIQAALAFVDAQREFYEQNPEGSPLLHYARRFSSTPGKRDGLYFETKPDEPPSPLGPHFDAASAEGYALGKGGGPTPYHGYYFKILEGQGPKAPGGAYSYLAGDKMIGGFALIAWPAEYGNSGVMTFLVNHDGVVYQRDLGKDTATKAKATTLFDLDKGTVRVPEQDKAEIDTAAVLED